MGGEKAVREGGKRVRRQDGGELRRGRRRREGGLEGVRVWALQPPHRCQHIVQAAIAAAAADRTPAKPPTQAAPAARGAKPVALLPRILPADVFQELQSHTLV